MTIRENIALFKSYGEAVPFARGVCKVLDALISISTMDNIGIHVLVYPPFQSSIALISISAMANIEFHFLVYPPLHCSRCSYFNIDHGQY